jgi:hypothetical protein
VDGDADWIRASLTLAGDKAWIVAAIPDPRARVSKVARRWRFRSQVFGSPWAACHDGTIAPAVTTVAIASELMPIATYPIPVTTVPPP